MGAVLNLYSPFFSLAFFFFYTIAMTSSPDISFEHFDPRFELDNLDNNGKPTRMRKKPGRKPNPPSPAQRKAQNRAAQRAFRERKRCEMKQAETAVKQCLYIRDQAIGETQRLKTELEETRYENNYLKGSLLILKLACIANRVDVPNLWDNSAADSKSMDLSKTNDLPQAMGIFLDQHRNIINFPQGNGPTSPGSLLPLSPMSVPLSPDSFVCSPPSSMVDLHQHEICPLLSSSPSSSYSGSNVSDSVQGNDRIIYMVKIIDNLLTFFFYHRHHIINRYSTNNYESITIPITWIESFILAKPIEH